MKTKIIVTVFLLIGLLSTVYALKYTANSVLYNSQIEEWNVSNVEEALNDLYLLNINNKELEWNSDTKELFIKKLPNDNSFKLFKVYSWPVENIDVFTSDGFDTGVSDGYTACARSGHNFAASVTDTINVASNENAGGGGIYTKKIDLTMYNKIVLTGYLTGKATTDSCGLLPAVTTTNSWGSAYSPAGYVTTLKCNATIGEVTMEIDISNLRGEYYIALGINQGYGYYKSIRLEI